MTTVRKLLAIASGFLAGYGLAALFLIGLTDFGVAAALAAVCWLISSLIRHIQVGRDKRSHPCAWIGIPQ